VIPYWLPEGRLLSFSRVFTRSAAALIVMSAIFRMISPPTVYG
jgi:hypothetical protein